MSDNLTTPIPTSSVMATKDVGGVHHPKNVITDFAGADILGLLTASPAANSFAGRFKAMVEALLDLAPAGGAFAITPNDTTTIATRAIYVGGTGTVVATIGGADVTFTAVPAGLILPVKVTKIKASSTATGIVGLT